MNHATGPEAYRGVKVPHRIRYAWDSPDALGWRHGVDASKPPREVTHGAAVEEIIAAAGRLESPALEARVLAALDWRAECEAVPKPPVRGELWSLLDWTFWGSGMGDVVREALADTMVAAIGPELRAQAESLMQSWHDSGRQPLGRRRYEELEAEVRELRARLDGGDDR